VSRPTATLEFSLEHPALRGHFPGNPIVPAVLLLDEVLHRLTSLPTPTEERASRGWQIGSAKFHRVVRPGHALTLELDPRADGSVGFVLSHSSALVAQGLLLPLHEGPSS